VYQTRRDSEHGALSANEVIIIVYYATKAANIYTQLHVQEHNKKHFNNY